MKVFELAGVIFNAENICSVQKINLKQERELVKGEEKKTPVFDTIPALQIVTVSGGINFTFKTEKERDEQFDKLFKGMEQL